MSKLFPIMARRIGKKLGYVPMEFMLRFDKQAQVNHGQSITQLAARGGLSAQEAMAVVNGTRWEARRWREEGPAWANLQIVVSAEYPYWDWDFYPAPASESEGRREG